MQNDNFDQQEYVSKLEEENANCKSQVKELKNQIENTNMLAYGNKYGPLGKQPPKSPIGVNK